MEGFNSHRTNGSLQIAGDVIEKISKLAALEVEGVEEVRAPLSATRTLLGRLGFSKPIQVEMIDDVANIEVPIVVRYGTKIPETSELVQENVKNSIQNMTSITVGRVDVVITGITLEDSTY